MRLHLVTTALEASWKFDAPTLFLGEWCRRFRRSAAWSSINAVVASAYGLGQSEKQRNVLRAEELTSSLLDELVPVLNDYHGTKHSVRYWQIVLGHWLQRYVTATLFRYFSLSRAMDSFDLSGTTVLNPAGYSLRTTDSLTFIWASNNDLWNHVFFSRIIQYINKADLTVEVIPLEGARNFSLEDDLQPRLGLRGSVGKLIFGSLLPTMSKCTDAFILNSYLPAKNEILLQLSLGQVPQRWRAPKLAPLPANSVVQHIPKLNVSGHTGFEKFVRELLTEVIPICFLEGFEALKESMEMTNWPSRPRFIFTSNNFDTDESFKIWAADKAEKGTPYFTGQHGNNYGTHFYYGNPSYPERAAADAFLTWGWNDGLKNTIPAFNFKIDSKQRVKQDPAGGLLLIETSATHRVMPWDVDAEHEEYIDHQFRFADALPVAIRTSMVVRLHAGSSSLSFDEPARWATRFPDISVDRGASSLRQLMIRSRLVVHSYDSTGILEMLAYNLPFICFWPNGWEHLADTAKPHYELLREAGIFQESPEHAAAKIMAVWDDIPAWWLSSQVQQAREAFCEAYSRLTRSPVADLAKLLTACAAGNSVHSSNVRARTE
jgi:putative transferase (TIGR04331 family)